MKRSETRGSLSIVPGLRFAPPGLRASLRSANSRRNDPAECPPGEIEIAAGPVRPYRCARQGPRDGRRTSPLTEGFGRHVGDNQLLDWIGTFVARQVSKPTSGYEPYAAARPELVAVTIRPADVLLVEGARSKINSADPLSDAVDLVAFRALCRARREARRARRRAAGAGRGRARQRRDRLAAVEIRHYNTRICRPVGLTPEDRNKVIRYAVERIGYAYDLKNIIDLMRYFLPQPPVPASWRRRMIALGSGEPTRAICSSLIAQAFESVDYPILPEVQPASTIRAAARSCTSATIRCTHRATSTFRRSSPSSSRRSRPGSITSR